MDVFLQSMLSRRLKNRGKEGLRHHGCHGWRGRSVYVCAPVCVFVCGAVIACWFACMNVHKHVCVHEWMQHRTYLSTVVCECVRMYTVVWVCVSACEWAYGWACCHFNYNPPTDRRTMGGRGIEIECGKDEERQNVKNDLRNEERQSSPAEA